MQVTCPQCQKSVDAAPEATGAFVACVHCGGPIQISIPDCDDIPDFGITRSPPLRRRRYSIPIVVVAITAVALIVWGTWPQIKQLQIDDRVTVGIVALIYFLPTLIAALRAHRSLRSIAAVNLLLGWTVLWWIRAFRVALAQSRMNRGICCPDFPLPHNMPLAVATSNRIGWIYLSQSGAYFKIGKTTKLDSRMRQLKIQLPDPLVLVHTIKTDNIDYAERHWHERFASKRRNGEWFALDSNDVREFRRYEFYMIHNPGNRTSCLP